MPYFFHCIDDPAKQSVRSEFMNEHLAYIETILDELAIAGPLKQAAEADPLDLILRAIALGWKSKWTCRSVSRALSFC